MAQRLKQATLMPTSPLPGQLSGSCPDGAEEVNGLCWLKFTLTPAQVKAGGCEASWRYEPSTGWCKAHLVCYEPCFGTRRNSVDGQ